MPNYSRPLLSSKFLISNHYISSSHLQLRLISKRLLTVVKESVKQFILLVGNNAYKSFSFESCVTSKLVTRVGFGNYT